MNETLLTVMMVVLVTAFFSFISLKQKKSSWKGTLIDKKVKEDDESGQKFYQLIFKTEEGKKVKVQVTGESAFNKFIIGDKFEKKAGEYFPEKI